MALLLTISKIVLNKDRSVKVDEEHLEVTKFKRALIDAVVRENERNSDVNLIVDIRARILMIVCKDPEVSLGTLGVGILTEYKLVSGFDALQLLQEDPREMKDIARFPTGPDVDHLLGFFHILKERGQVELRGTGPIPIIPGTANKTHHVGLEDKRLVLKGLASKNSEIQLQSAIDFKALSYRFVVLEQDDLVGAIDKAFGEANEGVISALVDLILGIQQTGTEKEKKVTARWIPVLKQIALSHNRADVAGRAFYILVLLSDPSAPEVLKQWIFNAADARYAGLNVAGFLRSTILPPLRLQIREAMYASLEEAPNPATKSRISEVLDSIRWN